MTFTVHLHPDYHKEERPGVLVLQADELRDGEVEGFFVFFQGLLRIAWIEKASVSYITVS